MKEQIGQNLRRIRHKMGMTQVEFADWLQISHPTLCNWERGKKKPQLDCLLEVAEKLGLSLDELVFGENRGEK